jgi:hypothetical protein
MRPDEFHRLDDRIELIDIIPRDSVLRLDSK